MKLNIYADPGHAWCRVPRALLVKLDIADKVSTYSYQRGDSVYLEEDCDLSLLIQALKAKGKTVEFKEFHTNKRSKIRSYDYYRSNDSITFKNGLDYMSN